MPGIFWEFLELLEFIWGTAPYILLKSKRNSGGHPSKLEWMHKTTV
jgi:hypothetical protein